MKRFLATVTFIVFLGISSTNAIAQVADNKLGIGFRISQVQNDFGIGLDLISPYFANAKVAVRVGGSFQWLEHVRGTETTWTPYQNGQVGVRGRQFVIDDKVFVYGEGGFIIIFPNDEFSAESTEFGGYGLFGFEFKPHDKFGFYLEVGGVGTGAVADKIVNRPIYSNGFLTNAGFRVTL